MNAYSLGLDIHVTLCTSIQTRILSRNPVKINSEKVIKRAFIFSEGKALRAKNIFYVVYFDRCFLCCGPFFIDRRNKLGHYPARTYFTSFLSEFYLGPNSVYFLPNAFMIDTSRAERLKKHPINTSVCHSFIHTSD